MIHVKCDLMFLHAVLVLHKCKFSTFMGPTNVWSDEEAHPQIQPEIFFFNSMQASLHSEVLWTDSSNTSRGLNMNNEDTRSPPSGQGRKLSQSKLRSVSVYLRLTMVGHSVRTLQQEFTRKTYDFTCLSFKINSKCAYYTLSMVVTSTVSFHNVVRVLQNRQHQQRLTVSC